ncbi:MAG: hypothetical protein IJ150_00420 [Bacteroidales bacterium]|nr:hypothetical protein [Bacteroidales bacterium]
MKNKPTLAIYGIKDRISTDYPFHVHDHNLCLMQDGEVLQYLHLERFTNHKYDNHLDLYLEKLIDSKMLLVPDEFDIVSVNNFAGNAFISESGRLRFESTNYRTLHFELENARAFFQVNQTKGLDITAFNCPHEIAHICSTLPFYGDFQDNSLLMSLDGGSSLGNYSAFLYRDGKFTLIENNWTDLGFASKFFNDNSFTFRMLGAKPGEHCSVPGKLMGFASWGNYDSEIEIWLKENQFFKDYWHKENSILESAKQRFGIVAEFDTHDFFMQNCAATFQRIFENAVLQKLENLQHKFHCDNLYYGGGCALNIVTNTKIVESGMFRNVYIAPCCNDSGLSIGAAALLERQKGNKVKIHSPYLNNVGIAIDNGKLTIDNETIKQTADIILNGGIIGICNGNGEAGPRALGNRSLIALPNNKQISQKLSMSVKKREWYRPVAPIMLKNIAEIITVQNVNPLAKFMLSDFEIKHEFDKDLCGVIHANQTARIQTLESENDNPFMFALLTYLYENHGIMALINTSFNAQGEPIVHTKNDALQSAKRMNLDAIIYNEKLIINN